MEFTQTVNVQATNDVEIGRKVRAIKSIAAEAAVVVEDGPEPDAPGRDEPAPPSDALVPYFDVGEATGKAGETVEIEVEAGCTRKMHGFHIGGGCGLQLEDRSGYGKFKAIGAKLGPYLRRYLKDAGAIHMEPEHVHDHFFSRFNFYDWDVQRALPEVWWEFVVGMFSLDQKSSLEPVEIPSGTHLFTLYIEILAHTPRGSYELTCKDEWYYKQARQRRRKFEWSFGKDPSTKIETFPGKITVL